MRIIAGEFRSRRLKSIPGLDTRPTPDRLREALFSILGIEVEGAVFADLYAGTGSVGLEALSRGARSVVLVERASKALQTLRENVAALGAGDRVKVWPEPVSKALRRLEADIVFLDPPYAKAEEYQSALEILAEGEAELVLVQHERRLELPEHLGSFRQVRQLKQGDNLVSFYRRVRVTESPNLGTI